MVGAPSGSVCAQSAPVNPAEVPDSCDPDYLDVLNARSYLEGKREMEQAQRIILKPDSVLEYSCFNEDIIFSSVQGGRFSAFGMRSDAPPEFDGTMPPQRVLPNSLGNSLTFVVETALVGFLYSFSHIYGGGSLPLVASPANTCGAMNVVWEASKCTNFNPNWWVTFEDLDSIDIRTFPIPCNESGRGANIAAALAAAYPAAVTPATNGGIDMLDPYVQELTGTCTAPGNAHIQTGISAIYEDGTIQDESVCVQPGCYFNGSACVN